jgi:hypothetical protein
MAAAQERITLETIGAVRMAKADAIRRASPELRRMETAAAREQRAERPFQAR